MLTKEERQKLLKEESNTGGVETQVKLLTKKIEKLSSHLKENAKDNHSRRGLLSMINNRKKLLSYLKRKDEEKHDALLSKVGLKKKK